MLITQGTPELYAGAAIPADELGGTDPKLLLLLLSSFKFIGFDLGPVLNLDH